MAAICSPVRTFAPAARDDLRTRAGLAACIGAALLLTYCVATEAIFERAGGEQFRFNWGLAVRLAVCAACGLYGLVHLRRSLSTLLSGAGLIVLAFGCWAAVSVAFAVNPAHSAGTVVCLWCVILFAAALNNELEPPLILGTVAVSLLGLLVATWIAHFFFPGISQDMQFDRTEMRLAGLDPPDTVGCWGALTVAMLIVVGVRRLARWRTLALPLAFAALTVIMTLTRTSMLAAAAVAIVAALKSTRPAKAVVITFVFVPLIAAVIAFGMMASGVETADAATQLSRSGELDEVYSMTGRTEIWKSVVHKIDKSPCVGYGYGGSRFVMEAQGPFPLFHAHNQLLNVILETGLVGGGLFLLQIVVLGLRFFTARDLFSDLVLVLVVLNGLTLRVMMTPVPDSLTLLWFMALLVPVQPSCPFARRTLPSAETA
jgi:O-antigen ligase